MGYFQRLPVYFSESVEYLVMLSQQQGCASLAAARSASSARRFARPTRAGRSSA
jgi:hypothetical protein